MEWSTITFLILKIIVVIGFEGVTVQEALNESLLRYRPTEQTSVNISGRNGHHLFISAAPFLKANEHEPKLQYKEYSLSGNQIQYNLTKVETGNSNIQISSPCTNCSTVSLYAKNGTPDDDRQFKNTYNFIMKSIFNMKNKILNYFTLKQENTTTTFNSTVSIIVVNGSESTQVESLATSSIASTPGVLSISVSNTAVNGSNFIVPTSTIITDNNSAVPTTEYINTISIFSTISSSVKPTANIVNVSDDKLSQLVGSSEDSGKLKNMLVSMIVNGSVNALNTKDFISQVSMNDQHLKQLEHVLMACFEEFILEKYEDKKVYFKTNIQYSSSFAANSVRAWARNLASTLLKNPQRVVDTISMLRGHSSTKIISYLSRVTEEMMQMNQQTGAINHKEGPSKIMSEKNEYLYRFIWSLFKQNEGLKEALDLSYQNFVLQFNRNDIFTSTSDHHKNLHRLVAQMQDPLGQYIQLEPSFSHDKASALKKRRPTIFTTIAMSKADSCFSDTCNISIQSSRSSSKLHLDTSMEKISTWNYQTVTSHPQIKTSPGSFANSRQNIAFIKLTKPHMPSTTHTNFTQTKTSINITKVFEPVMRSTNFYVQNITSFNKKSYISSIYTSSTGDDNKEGTQFKVIDLQRPNNKFKTSFLHNIIPESHLIASKTHSSGTLIATDINIASPAKYSAEFSFPPANHLNLSDASMINSFISKLLLLQILLLSAYYNKYNSKDSKTCISHSLADCLVEKTGTNTTNYSAIREIMHKLNLTELDQPRLEIVMEMVAGNSNEPFQTQLSTETNSLLNLKETENATNSTKSELKLKHMSSLENRLNVNKTYSFIGDHEMSILKPVSNDHNLNSSVTHYFTELSHDYQDISDGEALRNNLYSKVNSKIDPITDENLIVKDNIKLENSNVTQFQDIFANESNIVNAINIMKVIIPFVLRKDFTLNNPKLLLDNINIILGKSGHLEDKDMLAYNIKLLHEDIKQLKKKITEGYSESSANPQSSRIILMTTKSPVLEASFTSSYHYESMSTPLPISSNSHVRATVTELKNLHNNLTKINNFSKRDSIHRYPDELRKPFLEPIIANHSSSLQTNLIYISSDGFQKTSELYQPEVNKAAAKHTISLEESSNAAVLIIVMLSVIHAYTCGDVGSEISSSFINPSYPLFDQGTGTCSYRLYILESKICQLRVDFINTFLIGPTNGQCVKQMLMVNGSVEGLTLLSFCGKTFDQHFYVHLQNGDEISSPRWIDFVLRTDEENFPYRIKLKISQVALDNKGNILAPLGCLQLFSGPSGVVKSFNFEGNEYLNDMNYKICIKRASGACSLILSAMEGDFGLQKLNSRAVPYNRAGVGYLACLRDFLYIPGMLPRRGFEPGNRVCGAKFSYVHGDSVNRQILSIPQGDFFLIYVKTGIPVTFNAVTHGPGFRLRFEQQRNCLKGFAAQKQPRRFTKA